MFVEPKTLKREAKKISHLAKLLEQVLKTRGLDGIRLEPKDLFISALEGRDRFPIVQFVNRRANGWQTRRNVVFRAGDGYCGLSPAQLLKDEFKRHGFEEFFLETDIIDTTHAKYFQNDETCKDLKLLLHGITMELMVKASSRGFTILLEDVFRQYEWLFFDKEPNDIVLNAFESIESLKLKMNLILGEELR